MQCARGELLLFMDADGATRVSDLSLLESELLKAQKQVQVKIKVLGWDRLTSSLMIIGG